MPSTVGDLPARADSRARAWYPAADEGGGPAGVISLILDLAGMMSGI